MRKLKLLAERLNEQTKSREKQAERVRRIEKNKIRPKQQASNTKSGAHSLPLPSPEPSEQNLRLKKQVRRKCVVYQARATNDFITPQPWTLEITNLIKDTASTGGITLCLVWPSKLKSTPLLHALSSIDRIFDKNLRGLRTLLYPANHAYRSSLSSVLIDKTQLSNLFRELWISHKGNTTKVSKTESPAFRAALEAINDIRIHHSELPNPSLAEMIPSFIFDSIEQEWKTTITSPLEHTLSKVKRLARRQNLRQRVSLEWKKPYKAPSAIMAIHYTAHKKSSWQDALTTSALKDQGKPEVLLLDATESATHTNYAAVKRIPDFLLFARENGFSDTGIVIVADDPKTFFVLRAQLRSSKVSFSTKVWAVEAEEVLLSAHPVAADWQPAQRSNSNFSVSIVDRDASQLALKFQHLASSAGNEESPSYQALIQACMYVLRLSNIPAGYTDLTAASTEVGEGEYGSQQNAWTPVKLALTAALDSGALNQVRDSVELAIAQAEKLIDDWNDATPMASRVLAEVRKHAIASRNGISLVLPSNQYVLLTHHFLQRKLGDDWALAEARIGWHTLSGVGKTLAGDQKGKHCAFIGINPDALRILVTHPEVPHGTAVLVSYRRAESTLATLTGMKELEAFKAYQGRIGLLAQELERRLAEVPNPLDIGKLREMSLMFKFDENCQNGEQAYIKFELEGGGRAYASRWVYRHVPDEDPPFRRAAASSIQQGDFIFDMSDELRTKLESSLQLNSEGVSSVVDPVHMLLKLYHQDVQRRCALMFKATKRSALAREIHSRMVKLDPKAAECRLGRVYYWLALQENDTRPHASKDSKYFIIFCKALGMCEEAAKQHWGFVLNARRLNQYLGRELVSRYAEILFQPESAAIYRKVPEDVIQQLQLEALHCIYRVERVVMPPARVTTSKKGDTGAHPQ